jgi:hypothetical protein
MNDPMVTPLAIDDEKSIFASPWLLLQSRIWKEPELTRQPSTDLMKFPCRPAFLKSNPPRGIQTSRKSYVAII